MNNNFKSYFSDYPSIQDPDYYAKRWIILIDCLVLMSKHSLYAIMTQDPENYPDNENVSDEIKWCIRNINNSEVAREKFDKCIRDHMINLVENEESVLFQDFYDYIVDTHIDEIEDDSDPGKYLDNKHNIYVCL